MKMSKRIISLLLSVLMVLGAVAAGGISTSADTDETAFVKLYGLNEESCDEREFHVGDTFTVTVFLNASEISGGYIGQLKGEQGYTSSVLENIDEKDGSTTFRLIDEVFPVTKDKTTATVTEGRISYYATTPDFDEDAFNFNTDSSILITTKYKVISAGEAEVTNLMRSLKIADYSLTPIIDRGEIANDNFSLFVSFGSPMSADDGIVFNSAENRYEISNYAGLKAFAALVNGNEDEGIVPEPSACAVLTADIYANTVWDPERDEIEYLKDWVPIAKSGRAFTGTFDGSGYKITGLGISGANNINYSGLFGFIGEGGSVKNVRLENAILEGIYIGGIAYENRGTIQNCSFDGIIDSSGAAGGIACNNNGTITDCYNTGNVSGDSSVGGIAGSSSGTVANCYNTGSVSGNNYVGGVLGSNFNDGTLTNCYNTGSVTGNDDVGGIAGYMNKNNPSWACSVTNCYSAGSVTLSGENAGHAGGVVGYNNNCTVANCYYDSEKCSFGAIDGADNAANSVKGLSTAEMTGESALDNMSGLSSDSWLVRANADGWAYYPHLRGFAYDTDPTDANWPAKTEQTKADPVITLSVSPEEPVYGDDVTIIASLPDDATGDITLTVDGIDYTIPVKDGRAVLTVENPATGEHTVTASYPGDVIFNSATASGTFTVQAPVIAPTGISLDKHEINFTEGSSQALTAVIAPAGATGTVIWSSDNTSAATVIDNNDGTATVTAAGVGTAIIIVTIQGTDFSDSCTVNVTEYICPHTNKTEIPAKAATCTEPGNNRYYKCDDCGKYLKADGTTQTTQAAEAISALGHSPFPGYESNDTQHWQICSRCYEDIARENHTFGGVDCTWSPDNSTCTAKHTCTVCGKEVSETVDANSQDIPATCFTDGKIRYTATFTKPGFTTQTKEVSYGEPAGHDWGATAYVWSADNSTCTATRVCTRNVDHKEEETVNAAVTTTATCTEAGVTTYTARFENPAFETQIREVAVDALSHNWVKNIVSEATEDSLGLIEDKCSHCGDSLNQRYYILGNTSPSKYSNGEYISDDTVKAKAQAKLGDSVITVIVQDPLKSLLPYTVEIDSISSELGSDYDGNATPEKAYLANVILKQEEMVITGQLTGYVRVLLEIPEGWDAGDVKAILIKTGTDVEFAECIEYQVYDADGNYIKTVDKDYQPADGETVKVFAAIWTDHFSPYALIDAYTDKEALDDYKESAKEAADALAQEGDSEEIQALIADAKDEIEALAYDESKTLDENKAAVDEILAQLKDDIAEHRKEYTATFIADGETVDTVKFTVEDSTITEPEVPVIEGSTGEWEEYTLGAEDITVNAVYTVNEYTITYVIDGNETKVTYKYGDAVEKPADPVKDGFDFIGWDAEIPDTMPAENLTITAEFEAIPEPVEPTPTEPTPTEPTPTEPTPTEPTPTEPTPTEPTPTEPTPTDTEPAHEHDYKGEVTKEPTCTEDGVMTYTCECGETYTQAIPKTGHKPGEWTVVTPATTEAAGKEVRKCTVCEETIAEREIAKLAPDTADAEIVGVNLEKINAFGIANAFGVNPEKLPAGSTVTWYVNGEKAGEGNGFQVENPTEDYTIKAVVTNRDGKVIGETEETTVKVNNCFFARLYYWLCRIIQKVIDFFKNIGN